MWRCGTSASSDSILGTRLQFTSNSLLHLPINHSQILVEKHIAEVCSILLSPPSHCQFPFHLLSIPRTNLVAIRPAPPVTKLESLPTPNILSVIIQPKLSRSTPKNSIPLATFEIQEYDVIETLLSECGIIYFSICPNSVTCTIHFTSHLTTAVQYITISQAGKTRWTWIHILYPFPLLIPYQDSEEKSVKFYLSPPSPHKLHSSYTNTVQLNERSKGNPSTPTMPSLSLGTIYSTPCLVPEAGMNVMQKWKANVNVETKRK